MWATWRLAMGGVTLAGAAVLGVALSFWQSHNITAYCLYLYFALVATGMRLGKAGPMPVQFLFILAALNVFSFPETILLSCTTTLLDCVGRSRQDSRFAGTSFQVASAAVAAGSAYLTYHLLLIGRLHLEATLGMLLAASVFFAITTPLTAGAAALQSGGRFKKVWQESYLWSYPYYVVGAVIVGMFSTSRLDRSWQASLPLLPVLYLLYRSYRSYLKRVEQERRRAEEKAHVHLQTVEALAAAVEAKDYVTHEHLQRVQVYALELGRELCLSHEQMESLRAASILHDIGKVAIPEHILAKPGKLTPVEFERVKVHSIIGAEILARVDFPYPVAPVVRAHHERWDGSGYPDGLAGEQIPIAARILSVADCLDALTSDRHYRRALPIEEGVRTIVAQSGAGFDPCVVRALELRCDEMFRMAQQRCRATEKMEPVPTCSPAVAPAAGFQFVGPSDPDITELSTSRRRSLEAVAKQDLQATLELAEDLHNSLSFTEGLSVLAERLRTFVPYDSMALYVSQDGRLVPWYVAGESRKQLAAMQMAQGEGLSGWVAEHCKPIVNGNAAVEPLPPAVSSRPDPLRSALAVPLEGPDGGVLGVLSLYKMQENAFTEEQLHFLEEISPRISASVETVLRHREEHPTVSTDYLTGLPNARALLAQLTGEVARAQRTGEPFSLILLLVSEGGGPPDGYGGQDHNQVLRCIGKTISKACRAYDYVARWDTSGFAMVLPGLSSASLPPREERLREEVDQAIRQAFGERVVTLQAGAVAWPEHGGEAEDLLAAAERRLDAQSASRIAPGVARCAHPLLSTG